MESNNKYKASRYYSAESKKRRLSCTVESADVEALRNIADVTGIDENSIIRAAIKSAIKRYQESGII